MSSPPHRLGLGHLGSPTGARASSSYNPDQTCGREISAGTGSQLGADGGCWEIMCRAGSPNFSMHAVRWACTNVRIHRLHLSPTY